MYIKRLEIDGFKSYSKLQVIDGFDTQFNAITGLNGTGKSNILDSICFVLGITNLTHIRAGQLHDLVYKQGQAGITKATVTITFDNKDKKHGPIGYHHCDEITIKRQIIVNGRNTYTINGTTTTNAKVSDFFRSVGLNVNNPHFLIMQGRITKVLNMKPHEILGMIEEAAGTKLYEAKRTLALNTINKKQSKVDEIEKLMAEDILPQLEKLQRDKQNFLEYNNCDQEIERLERKLIAFTYYISLVSANECEKLAVEKTEEIKLLGKELQEVEAILEQQQADLTGAEDAKKKRYAEAFSVLEANVAKELAKVEACDEEKRECKESFGEILTEYEEKRKSLDDEIKQMKKKEADLAKWENEIGSKEQAFKSAEEHALKAREKLNAVAQGMTTDDSGNAISVEEQITGYRSKLKEIAAEVSTTEEKKKRILPELKRKQAEYEQISKKNSAESSELRAREAEVRNYKEELKSITYDEDAHTKSRETLVNFQQEVHQMQIKLNILHQKNPRIHFTYKDPFPGFNRDDVRGCIAILFRVKDPKYALALEIAAGSFLYNVVVKDKHTARLIVETGLPHRRTFVPWTEVIPRHYHDIGQRFRRAQELAKKYKGESMMLALDLIEYDPVYTKVFELVFGGILICDTIHCAKEVVYDSQVKLRAVTARGDDLKPTGTMSGGAPDKRGPILLDLIDYTKYKSDIAWKQSEIERLGTEVAKLDKTRTHYVELKDKLERASTRLDTLRESFKDGPLQQLSEEIKTLEKELPECDALLREMTKQAKELNDHINAYEERKRNEQAFIEKAKIAAQKESDTAEKRLEQAKSNFEALSDSLTRTRGTLATMKEQIAKEEEMLASVKKRFDEFNDKITVIDERRKVAEKDHEAAVSVLKKFEKELKEYDKGIKAQQDKVDATNKRFIKLKSKQSSLETDIQKAKEDCVAYKKMAHIKAKAHPWIYDEKAHFGEKDTEYDFTGYTQEKATKAIADIKARKNELGKNLNTRAMGVLSHVEEQVLGLKQKKEQIAIDKRKLLDTIALLDVKKTQEIHKAYTQVNRDFGNIFSTLLPGASAKLEPPAGKTVEQGLEVKVAFNMKWKDSLQELSGGQRSLVALSLVLAMLKFRPAPIYILDEVDAALDLSHTQNIGHMIKKHFTTSQFIIVSLKEGMFNHANVLYRTKFCDGTSQVVRTTNKS
ncbi:Structural maintenance of chromosomes protein 2 [Parelaphostrongylus tenuis]|uniref:Structural maintenance of chromosomes protein n=1 Tax=Parelaphostrongylus tenuis TaxID=148309 RepID=A0AAD5QVD3_PARTN|nr:Structural maintenance of chromosomes protein 2 [Parelaphostrongylus tenuis]